MSEASAVPNTDAKASAELEIDATRDMYKLLKSLDSAAQSRVVTHVTAMLGIVAPAKGSKPSETLTPPDADDSPALAHQVTGFATFAEFFAAFDPLTESDKALAAGYWIQVGEKADSFDAQRANKELKHLGHAVGNITNALSALMQLKPAPVVQLKKAGSTRQARKTYKVTGAGVKIVEDKLGG
jgi:hypothetical protein